MGSNTRWKRGNCFQGIVFHRKVWMPSRQKFVFLLLSGQLANAAVVAAVAVVVAAATAAPVS